MHSAVEVHIDGRVAQITVGDGSKQNALDGQGWTDLAAAIDGLDADVAVLTGRGETFCAGSDMTEWVDAGSAHVERSFALMEAAFEAVERAPMPVIAAVSGVAAGAGCQLALACDLRVLHTGARIGMPIARLGILPSAAFAARMVAVAGPSITRLLLYTGRLLTADEAHRTGLADLVADDATATAAGLAQQVAGQPAAAVRAAKAAVSTALWPMREAGRRWHERAVSDPDFRRGIHDFLDHGEQGKHGDR